MAFLAGLWTTVTSGWKTILVCVSVVIILFAVEQYRLKSVTKDRDQLKGIHEQDIAAVGKANETVTQVLADTKRQVNIIAKQRNDAIKLSTEANARYLQIMSAPAAEDGPISVGLCNGIERLRSDRTATTDAQLQVHGPAGDAGSTPVARASTKCTYTQKDIDAWLETQVKPAFDTCRARLQDLSQYLDEKE